MSAPEESWSAAAATRPAGVPDAARWSNDEQEWQQSATDAEGRLEGAFRSWRSDGTLRTIAWHRGGKRVDVSWQFHPDGSLFSVGTFVDGVPRGAHRRYASHTAVSERLQSCCVPEGAWQRYQKFRADGTVDLRWFDRDGGQLLESGAPYPPRPDGVPAEASFNEDTDTWEAGLSWAGEGYSGTRRRWAPNGVLRLIENLSSGKRQGEVRWFDENGAPSCDAHYESNRLSGPTHSHQLPPSYFRDPTLTQYTGTFERDQAVGAWRLLRADGSVAFEYDLGAAIDDDLLATILANEARPATAWHDVAASAFQSGQVALALLATARGAARAGDVAGLQAALAARALPLDPEAARTGAAALIANSPDDAVLLTDGLRRGWDASVLLLAIAKTLMERDRAAIDFVTAAVLLAPGAAAPLSTRALLHGDLGDPQAARRDIEDARAGGAEQATFLDLYLRTYFPTFDFWPARELAAAAAPGLAPPGADDETIAPQRTPPEVQEIVSKYAARLARLAALIEARAARPGAVMVPDVAALAAALPAALACWTFSMSAAEYGGELDPPAGEPGIDGEAAPPQTRNQGGGQGGGQEADADAGQAAEEAALIEIKVDETHGLDLDGAPLLRILRRARADWAGLTWLCWAVGLDHVGVPQTIARRENFARQALLTMERTWRCRDRLKTSGLLALTKGVPSFDWEGVPIEALAAPLVEVALDEYIERRAVFAWLCDPANRSPWQDDLRGD